MIVDTFNVYDRAAIDLGSDGCTFFFRRRPRDRSLRRLHGSTAADRIARDIDGTSFWAIAGQGLQRFDLDTGAIVATIPVEPKRFVAAFTVIGEPRAATLEPSAVPAWSSWSLLLLGATIAALGVVRLHGA